MPVSAPVSSPTLARPARSRLRHNMLTTAAVTATVVSAAWRAAAAVIAGLLLCGGVALVLWAVMPSTEADAGELVRGGVTAFAAANFLPVSVGDTAVTIHPLMLTLVLVGVVASSAGRARVVHGRVLEALHASVFAVAYALCADVATALFAVPGTVRPGLLAPLCVAGVGVLLALGWHRTAWRGWWRRQAPGWLQSGLRSAVGAICLVLAAGSALVAVGLVVSFSDATAITSLLADSAGDGLGVLILCLLLLPNAAIGAVGYVTGAGFDLGAAHVSPLAVHTADLPAVPLLAAIPAGPPAPSAWLVFLVPVLTAGLMAWRIVRDNPTRSERLLAVAAGALTAGLLAAGLAAVAAGGVAGGDWAATGAPALLTGGLLAGFIVVVAGAAAAAAGGRSVPWALLAAVPDPDTDATPAGDRAPDEDGASDGAETPVEDQAPDADETPVEDQAPVADQAPDEDGTPAEVETGRAEEPVTSDAEEPVTSDAKEPVTADAETDEVPPTGGSEGASDERSEDDADQDGERDSDEPVAEDRAEPQDEPTDTAAADRAQPRDTSS